MTVYLFQDITNGQIRVFKTMKTLCSVYGYDYQTIRKAMSKKDIYMRNPCIIRKVKIHNENDI